MMRPVTSTLGNADAATATRVRQPGWRDPRLWVGVTLVAVSVLAGARLLAAADDTVSVWALTTDLAPGETLEREDLVARQVHFADGADLERYLAADDALPAEREVLRPIAAGELVPRAAIGRAGDTGLLTVPLGLPRSAVPPSVGVGDHVDVWVSLDNAAGGTSAKPVLRDVTVLAVPSGGDATFGVSEDRQLVLGVSAEQEHDLGRVLAAVGERQITVVGRS